jgi:transposase InsO family protein
LVKYVALRLKREHPGWGVDVVLLHLQRRPSLVGKRLPKRSTLAAYFQSFSPRLKEHRRLPTHRPTPAVEPVDDVHQRWQMDFKGRIYLTSIGYVQPLMICDEWSSAPLAAILYTSRTGMPTKGMNFRDVQAALRTVFTQWGLPDQLRMDRDPLWVGSPRLEWPGTLLLWLVGLDIVPVINRAARPTDNAQVERLNRTWFEHVALGTTYTDLAQLQHSSDQAWQDRRNALPSRNPHCQNLPPLVACPGLSVPRRRYTPAIEPDLFDLQRVYHYLSQWDWQRKVDCNGQISLADINYFVGRAYSGQVVQVRFDALNAVFVATAMDGTVLNRFASPVITQEYILGVGV